MTFDEWIEPHLSAMQISDSTINMMRAAFEAGKYCDHTLPSYCGQCGGKVVLKERMCSLGGIEFPAPKIMDLDTDILTDSYVELEHKRYEFKNETDRHTFMIALQAAVTQAIEAAK